jgi:urea transport system permease protein
VYGKVFILVGVILFLQWRPSGLFAAKGRSADA